MSVLIVNRLTPMTADEASKALSAAYKTVTKSSPNEKVLGLLVGQWATETGNGKYIHNFNYGNVKHTSGDSYYQQFEGSEVIDGVNQVMLMDFAAHLTAEDGAIAFINQLKKRAQWWAGLQTGDPKKYVDGLILINGQHYFTGDPTAYLKLLVDRMNTYRAEIKRYASSYWKSGLQVIFGLALGAAGVYGYKNREAIAQGVNASRRKLFKS
jgi:hypothetical protein